MSITSFSAHDQLATFDAAVASANPHLTGVQREAYAALVLNELAAVVARGGHPAAMAPGGTLHRLSLQDLPVDALTEGGR